jgi:hypothetical protein
MTNAEKIDALELAQTISAAFAASARRFLQRILIPDLGTALDLEFISFDATGGVFTITATESYTHTIVFDPSDETLQLETTRA